LRIASQGVNKRASSQSSQSILTTTLSDKRFSISVKGGDKTFTRPGGVDLESLPAIMNFIMPFV